MIVGFVDGTTQDEATGQKLVVEMKNRMRRVHEPPPLRDMIQLCLYLRMLGCAEGDLVQCVRTNDPVQQVSVSRVRLDGEHDRGWRDQVRPRLYGEGVAEKGGGVPASWSKKARESPTRAGFAVASHRLDRGPNSDRFPVPTPWGRKLCRRRSGCPPTRTLQKRLQPWVL